jgi:hypothetical protein
MADMKRTAFAQQGLDFVTLFSAKFHRSRISGYAPVLREPPGETTGGGQQAVQHMILEPRMEGDPVWTIGYVNLVTKTAKLRTYDCMAMMHGIRFPGTPFPISHQQYQEFLDKVTEFARRQGLQLQIETRPPALERASHHPSVVTEPSDIVLWIILAAIVVGTSIAAYMRITGRL